MEATNYHEKQKKGAMFVYNFDTGNPKPESNRSPVTLKKVITRGFGLRRSKTYREVDRNGVKGVNHVGEDKLVETRKSICSSETSARKSVCSSETSTRKSVSRIQVNEGRKSVSHIEVNVASMAAFLRVKVLVTDMPGFMQVHAFRCARKNCDSFDKFSSKNMACNMKKEFDKVYGPAWHCIVGSSFGSYVTHSTGYFLYFSIEKLYILVFRTKVQKAPEYIG